MTGFTTRYQLHEVARATYTILDTERGGYVLESELDLSDRSTAAEFYNDEGREAAEMHVTRLNAGCES